jgi:hypothetical protein
LDYRLSDTSLTGARLRSRREGTNLVFAYEGLPASPAGQASAPVAHITRRLDQLVLRPGEERAFATFDGPGILRELRLQWPTNTELSLKIRYDDAETFAVNSPLRRFFGSFQGVSFFQHSPGDASCYLPMPFRRKLELLLKNQGKERTAAKGSAVWDSVSAFDRAWGYFHALYQQTARTDGHRLHQVLYARGKGHWLGMSLYKTGHDHGGGDFAVIDGEGEQPAFLHGLNGEDYFTFAWFGKGAHHPYAIAPSNDEGRYRHHFENVYPFTESVAIEWGAFSDLQPESVAVWYQQEPGDTTLPDGARSESVQWDVFGPVTLSREKLRTADELLAALPPISELDAGKKFECQLVKEKFLSGWQKEWTVGPMLNLIYVARHGTKVNPEGELGGMGHAFLARRFVSSLKDEEVPFLFAHDDPVEVWVNGDRVYRGEKQANGFESTTIELPFQAGKNEIVVRITNYFNRNFNWSGFLLRPKSKRAWP